MKNKQPTICVNCKWYRKWEPEDWQLDVAMDTRNLAWYAHLWDYHFVHECHATAKTDYVTGKETVDVYNCEMRNRKGRCRYFVSKEEA